jgi:glycosyltransferase involved in cell wall biosynthesis
MRILRSISSVKPEYGGPIEGIKQVTRVHQQLGHKVEMVSLDAPDDPWVRDFPIPLHALGPAKGKFKYTPRLSPWVRDHAARFDAVVINGIWQFNSLGVFLGLRRSRTPYFVFPHGMLDPWFKHTYPLKHLKKWLYWPWAEYRVLRNARAVCFTCEEERRLARQSFWLYDCQEEVVSYGTAAPAGDPQQQRELFWDRYPTARGKRLILFLGRIHPKKGCDLLIRAFARLCSAGQAFGSDSRPLHLVLAGPDQIEWLPRLKTLADEFGVSHRITWTGMLSGELKLGAFRAAEVFALPSHQENFGIAVAEALGCSLPVLLSNKVNIWREVEQDRAGLVANDDEEGVIDSLRRWLAKDDQERQVFRDNAGKCFMRRFEIRSAADSLLRIFASRSNPPTSRYSDRTTITEPQNCR